MNTKPSLPFSYSRLFRQVLSAPFVLIMIFPTVIFDLFLTLYNNTALPLYKIPRVHRNQYITFDRTLLAKLSIFMKLCCYYCSYVNGLFAYAVELAARTERYWCPLKDSRRDEAQHKWYREFAGKEDIKWPQKFFDDSTFKK